MSNSKSKNRWKTSNTTVFNLGVHIIFCPKYRRRVLVGSIRLRFIELLEQKSKELEFSIEEKEVLDDHVHLFLKIKPIHSVQFIVQQIKGYSSRVLREEFPELRSRMCSLWTRSYFVESVGIINEETCARYIENQIKTRNSSHS